MFHTGRTAGQVFGKTSPPGFVICGWRASLVRLLQRIALFYARVPCVSTVLSFAALAG
jgi:hypothetical protein